MKLQRDHARACARVILDMVRPCLRDDECTDAYRMFEAAILAALLHYEKERKRCGKPPPRPSRN